MIKKIVLIGAGGFGREVAHIIERLNDEEKRYDLIGFLDDGSQFGPDSSINGYPWLGNSNWIVEHKDEAVCNCTIGNAALKAEIQERLMGQGVRFETIIASGVGIGKFSEIGAGCVFYRNVGISVNCKIGDGVLLNNGVTVGHDAVIGNYSCVMPGTGISGGCVIGERVNIGGHAFMIPGRKVGDGARVAAGSVVFTNVKAGTTVLGNPAKRIQALE
ncbi:MAG: NeuD/PglB/VioB family sugar acetyltransferase [Clostridia bacterium]|nr:NeuD/PglB/VioB family sugar acetyltransferase [Clostridia bacterium]